MVESCQVMSTACYAQDSWIEGMPKPTHAKHPVVLWAGSKAGNWDWTWQHAEALEAEWQRRWQHDRRHKTLEAMRKAKANRVLRLLPKGRTENVNCARNTAYGIDYTWMDDVHLAYKSYLSMRWLLQKRPAVCKIPLATVLGTRENPVFA